MNRTFFPLFLIILAGALFVFYTNPAYQSTKASSATLSQYNAALNQSEELLKVRDQLLSQRNSIPQDNLNKLQLLLPDNIDNIRLIIDINDIAARYHLQVQDISVGGPLGAGSQDAALGDSASPVGQVTLGFAVNASYNNFVAFLNDLEHSLRLVDVSSITFDAGDKGLDNYNMVITTYWLK